MAALPPLAPLPTQRRQEALASPRPVLVAEPALPTPAEPEDPTDDQALEALVADDRCLANTQRGQRCSNPRLGGEATCATHRRDVSSTVLAARSLIESKALRVAERAIELMEQDNDVAVALRSTMWLGDKAISDAPTQHHHLVTLEEVEAEIARLDNNAIDVASKEINAR